MPTYRYETSGAGGKVTAGTIQGAVQIHESAQVSRALLRGPLVIGQIQTTYHSPNAFR